MAVPVFPPSVAFSGSLDNEGLVSRWFRNHGLVLIGAMSGALGLVASVIAISDKVDTYRIPPDLRPPLPIEQPLPLVDPPSIALPDGLDPKTWRQLVDLAPTIPVCSAIPLPEGPPERRWLHQQPYAPSLVDEGVILGEYGSKRMTAEIRERNCV